MQRFHNILQKPEKYKMCQKIIIKYYIEPEQYFNEWFFKLHTFMFYEFVD